MTLNSDKFKGLADSFVKGSKARKITPELVDKIGSVLIARKKENPEYTFTTATVVQLLQENKVDYSKCTKPKQAIVTGARSVLRAMGLLNTKR